MDEARKSVYIETTIPSYATSRPSADPVAAGHQASTQFFWKHKRDSYDFFISQTVVNECSRGNPEAAQRRISFLKGIEPLKRPAGIEKLADIYQQLLDIPDDAKADCEHLAYCVLEKIDYLLSWNCNHLGPIAQEKMRAYNDKHGLWTPLLVTPEVLSDL